MLKVIYFCSPPTTSAGCRVFARGDGLAEGPAQQPQYYGLWLTHVTAVAGQQWHIKFTCLHCGQAGEVVWRGTGIRRELVRLTNGFHCEEGRTQGIPQAIVCDVCDEIDPVNLL